MSSHRGIAERETLHQPYVQGARLWLNCLLVSLSVASAFGAVETTLSSAPPGRMEAGVPSFVVFGPEAMGLNGLPLGLHLLPDGRLLVTSSHEIAFGDGVRWETYRSAEDSPVIYSDTIVDDDGSIYCGTEGAIGRLEIGADGLWRVVPVQRLPDTPEMRKITMLNVTKAGSEWYWLGGGGNWVRWRPHHELAVIPTVRAAETVFVLGDDVYGSERSSGALFCVTKGGGLVSGTDELPSELITVGIPFDDTTVLLGTSQSGLRLFDGKKFQPFGEGNLAGGFRINDLCAMSPEMIAAAIDTVGVVFLDRKGKVLQVLDARLDHRLGRVKKLQYSADGMLWGLLNEGVVRVEVPSRHSRFEPLLASGLAYAAPYRHQGDLWILADGRVLRAVYKGSGHLDGFVAHNPPGRFAFTLNTVGDELFAGTDVGIFQWVAGDWKPVASGIVNARIGIARTASGALVYAARGEIGTLVRSDKGYEVHRIPVPNLGDSYNSRVDQRGFAWLELGIARVARVEPHGEVPTIEQFGTSAGLLDGWVSLFTFDGVVRAQVPNHILRFDESTSRFVEDKALVARFPHFQATSSRPEMDRQGRLWYNFGGRAWNMDMTAANPAPQIVPLPFTPIEYKFEEDGVVWLMGNGKLQRYDTRMPERVSRGPRVLITSVQFPNSNRQLFNPRDLGTIPYIDNTIMFRFSAPGNSIASPSTFQVRLRELGDRWVSTGNTGDAMFNRLREGHYHFQVRAVNPAGESSAEAEVTFAIAPPWFRAPLAWVIYLLGGVGLLIFAMWFPAYRQRRQKRQLEVLVAKRTQELNNTNQQLSRQIEETIEKSRELAVSEERYRTLSAELEQRVDARTAELSTSNRELHQRESLFRLIFEHAAVGISWKRADLDNVHHFNATYRRILDLPDETLSDYTLLSELVHPDDRVHQSELNARLARGEVDSYRLEERFVLKNGRLVWGSLCVAVVRDSEGRILQEIGILEDITGRKNAELQLAATYKELVDASRMAGMAEVATGVLHNVGNVLNSLNVSGSLISTKVRASRAESLIKLSALLDARAPDLGRFLTEDPKGRLIPDLLKKLAEAAAADRDWLLHEIASMQRNIDHIKEIVAMQQNYATVIGVTEEVDPESLFEDALRMNTAALTRHDVRIVKDFQPAPKVCVERGKVLQILINLIRNAKYACDDAQPAPREKLVTVRIEAVEGDRVRFVVQDNGVGIAPENLTRIFAHGFTTRAYGHGFGLHSSANAAQEMRGSLRAASEGVGKGATFTLEIPAETPSPASRRNTSPRESLV